MDKYFMEENDIDRLEEVFRSKLRDFEAMPEPEDWEAIVRRLPAGKSVSLYRNLRYWAAAAVVTLMAVIGTLYLVPDEIEPIVEVVKEETEALKSQMRDEIAGTTVQATVEPQEREPILATVPHSPAKTLTQTVLSEDIPDTKIYTEPVEAPEREDEEAEDEPQLRSVTTRSQSLPTADPTIQAKGKPARKWRFGMGGGGLSMGTGNVVPQYMTNSSTLRSEDLQYMNKEHKSLPKTNVKHKIPISFGLAASRSLSERFSLQTGLTYSYLLSEWDTNGQSNAKTQQGLHFVGIPLSLNYLIAEWNRFQFYGTGGVMAEMNVGGRKNIKYYEGDQLVLNVKEDFERMKPLQWSLNARVGVSYPLLRFLSAYAEGGAGYYFDNGSDIETIRTEKPFDLNFQFGLRVGF